MGKVSQLMNSHEAIARLTAITQRYRGLVTPKNTFMQPMR